MAVNNSNTDASNNPVPLYLIPWDPDSQDHVDRMKLQRIACGWKVDQVDSWRSPQREGKNGLHWVVLNPDHPSTPSRLEKHHKAHPNELSPLQNTAKKILTRHHKPNPLMSTFHPIGHIALDAVTSQPELETDLSHRILSLMNFYISTALQNEGLGGAALACCEKIAKEEINAKAITLETIANEECQPDSPRRIALKRPIPKITNQDWYSRRGYKVYNRRSAAWVDVDETGKSWPVSAVFLRKDLA